MLLIVHAAATWLMVGLIWTMQAVHYPLFRLVGPAGFPVYEGEHVVRMGRLLAAPALTEAVTGVLLLWLRPSDVTSSQAGLGLLLLALIWLVTAVVQVPLHGFLRSRYDPTAVGWLVRTNWLRTALWSVRGVLVALMLLA